MIAIWDAHLSVGDPLLDAEHRRVVALLNELGVALAVGAPALVVEKALETLVRTIDTHFARDERMVGEHVALSASAHRLLEEWRHGRREVLDRRALVGLAGRWIAHMGRREAAEPVCRLAG